VLSPLVLSWISHLLARSWLRWELRRLALSLLPQPFRVIPLQDAS
jgi:hypothetical protein